MTGSAAFSAPSCANSPGILPDPGVAGGGPAAIDMHALQPPNSGIEQWIHVVHVISALRTICTFAQFRTDPRKVEVLSSLQVYTRYTTRREPIILGWAPEDHSQATTT